MDIEAKLSNRIIENVTIDEEYHQGLVIVFKDGTKLKISGHSNYSDEQTWLELEYDECDKKKKQKQ